MQLQLVDWSTSLDYTPLTSVTGYHSLDMSDYGCVALHNDCIHQTAILNGVYSRVRFLKLANFVVVPYL